jgi:hypothetical protein
LPVNEIRIEQKIASITSAGLEKNINAL